MFVRPLAVVGTLSIVFCSVPEAARAQPVAPSPHRIEFFTSSEQCAVCHTVAPGANAMRSTIGEDVSPYGMWQGTMMANAFRDPYFRAQLQKETAAAGEEVQELCLRCHTPMVHHGAMVEGNPPPRLADAEGDLFADDGVSCTVCHLMSPEGFGEASSFSGKPKFNKKREIYGPFAGPLTRPMQNLVRYTPTQGLHVLKSALCATCHTLTTQHHGTPFPEQTPYLEWRNSDFSDEQGEHEGTRTCQQCHMPKTGPTRMARSPMGFDFASQVRDDYVGHLFVGGNAFMLGLLARYRDLLDVTAEPEALARTIAATRRQLGESTATVTISAIERNEGTATFAVKVENLTGHKFPSGYPSRRAWLHVSVEQGGSTIFESGAPDERGHIAGVGDEMLLPHVQTVEKPEQVVVYEMIANDPDGQPTTYLTKMVAKRKDNRLLPRGWKSDGPDIAQIAPVGTEGDEDFVGGSDTVYFKIPLQAKRRGRVVVSVAMLYQTVPPMWVDALRPIEALEAKRFVEFYDAAEKEPEHIAFTARSED